MSLSNADTGRAVLMSSLLSSKLCHDLAGAIGAVCNGLELMEDNDSPDMTREIAGLISQGADEARTRLQFFRIALGAGGSEALAADELCRTARTVLSRGGRITIGWTPAGPDMIPREDAKFCLCLLHVGAGCLAGRGTLQLHGNMSRSDARLDGEGQLAAVPDDFHSWLGAGPDAPLTRESIMPCYLGTLARLRGCGLSFSTSGGRFSLALSPRR